MKFRLALTLLTLLSAACCQSSTQTLLPRSHTLCFDSSGTFELHLAPGYISSVRLPETVSSVVVGDPSIFKAEHSEGEQKIIFFKPLSPAAAQSNALVVTKSGRQYSFLLTSAGKPGSSPVDFFVDCQSAPAALIVASDPDPPGKRPAYPDPLDAQIGEQRLRQFPKWDGDELSAFVGSTRQSGQKMLVAFSVMNRSRSEMELLPPQVELGNITTGKHKLKSEPVMVSLYRLSSRRIGPGERSDGVLVFTRPPFKETREQLQLRLARAEKIDQPVLLSLPFTAREQGEIP